jgi:pimeloyl-ACP methyl ester carboxylesterase
MTVPTIPVIFIHGLWLHATSWSSWTELFTTVGYDAAAPGWPGDGESVEQSRKDPDSIADHGIDDVVAHYTEIINALDVKPILIGHSFGGMIAEKLLGQDLARAAIAIDAAQIKGVLPLPLSALRSPRRASRCSRPPSRTSPPIRRPRSTPATTPGDRCC